VVEAVDAPGHLDTPWPAEVTWGPLAVLGFPLSAARGLDVAGPAFTVDGDTITCVVYCHGATLPGGATPAPTWTGGPAQVACGACHAIPPPHPDHLGHLEQPPCAGCHPHAGSDLVLHGDGEVQTVCDDCHGADGDPAPPPDTRGRRRTTFPSVGAHQTHVTGTAISAPIACSDCHVLPTAVDDAGHLDDAPAEVVFSGAATVVNATPSYQGTTCTDTACHARGGTNPAPDWVSVGAGEAACGACHGTPPDPPHPQNPACGTCHPDADAAGAIVDPSRHVDGTTDYE
jgi:predicted CxxxxCH...CXXCH cytochrome family protein